jgi:hypothetical protein
VPMSEGGFNRQLKITISLLNNWHDFLKLTVPMSEDGFNRQLKMAISLLNNWHDFLKIQITFSNKRCQCMPVYIYCFFCTELCCKSLAKLRFSNGHRLNSINQTIFFDFEIF